MWLFLFLLPFAFLASFYNPWCRTVGMVANVLMVLCSIWLFLEPILKGGGKIRLPHVIFIGIPLFYVVHTIVLGAPWSEAGSPIAQAFVFMVLLQQGLTQQMRYYFRNCMLLLVLLVTIPLFFGVELLNRNSVGTLSLFLMLSVFQLPRDWRSIVYFAIAVVGLVVSQARNDMLSAFLSIILLIWWWWYGRRRGKVPVWFFFATLSIAFSIVILLVSIALQHENGLADLLREISGRIFDKSLDSGRGALWASTLKMVYNSPLMGRGLGADITMLGNGAYLSAHNVYVQLLGQTGIVGLLLFLYLLFIVFRRNNAKQKEGINSNIFLLVFIIHQNFTLEWFQNSFAHGVAIWLIVNRTYSEWKADSQEIDGDSLGQSYQCKISPSL